MSQLKCIIMWFETGRWTYQTLRTLVKDPTAGTRNDLILFTASDAKILFWCIE